MYLIYFIIGIFSIIISVKLFNILSHFLKQVIVQTQYSPTIYSFSSYFINCYLLIHK